MIQDRIKTSAHDVDETGDLLHEYRQAISQLLEKELVELRRQAQEKAESFVALAEQNANRITREAEAAATKRADDIVAVANAKAEQLLAEAQKSIRKEARDRTQREVEKSLIEAKNEASRIVAEAQREAGKLAEQATDEARKQAEQLLQDAGVTKLKAEAEAKESVEKANETARQVATAAHESARHQTEKDVQYIMAEARQRAEQTVQEAQAKAISEQARLTGQILASIRSQAEAQAAGIVEEARKQAHQMLCNATEFVHKELSESVLLLQGAQQRIEKINQETAKYAEPPPMPAVSPVVAEEPPPPAPAHTENTVAHAHVAKDKVFKGIVKLSVLPPANFNEVDRLQKQIAQLPGVRVVGAGAREDAESWVHWVHLELAEPMALVAKLSKIPHVKSVTEQDNTLAISLREK